MKLTLSTAQTVALHTAESVGLSALITVVVGIGQYVATNGLNVPGLLTFAGALFVGAMGMVYKSLSTNQQVMAGISDTLLEVRAAFQQDVARLADRLSGGHAPVAPAPLIQPPAQLDAASVADVILHNLDLGQVAQGVAQELMKVRVPQSLPAVQPPSPAAAGQQLPIPQRPTMPQPAYAPQQQQQPGRPG